LGGNIVNQEKYLVSEGGTIPSFNAK